VRLLMWHVSAFRSEPGARGRSKLADAPRAVAVGEALLVFASVERADEGDGAGVVARACDAVVEQAGRVGARTVVLHSFAHLFGELASPSFARQVLDELEAELRGAGFSVEQTPFGWFNALEIHAKGHPLARVARQV
jgi:hypothetical protein